MTKNKSKEYKTNESDPFSLNKMLCHEFIKQKCKKEDDLEKGCQTNSLSNQMLPLINNKNHRIKREEFDTIGIIESKYELVKGKVTIGENIKIEIPKIDENDYYSVLVDYPNEKEKYVFNTINTPKPESKVWILILIFSGIPLLLTIIIFVIIYASKSSNYDLKEKIMQTSFKESGAVEKSSEDEDNVLK